MPIDRDQLYGGAGAAAQSAAAPTDPYQAQGQRIVVPRGTTPSAPTQLPFVARSVRVANASGVWYTINGARVAPWTVNAVLMLDVPTDKIEVIAAAPPGQAQELVGDDLTLVATSAQLPQDAGALAAQKLYDLQAQLTALRGDVQNVKSSTDLIQTKVDAVKTSSDTTGTKVDAVKTSADAIKASADATKAAVDAQALYNLATFANVLQPLAANSARATETVSAILPLIAAPPAGKRIVIVYLALAGTGRLAPLAVAPRSGVYLSILQATPVKGLVTLAISPEKPTAEVAYQPGLMVVAVNSAVQMQVATEAGGAAADITVYAGYYYT